MQCQMQPSQKESGIGAVRCKKEEMLRLLHQRSIAYVHVAP